MAHGSPHYVELPQLYVTVTAVTDVRPVTLYVTTADLTAGDLVVIPLTADSTLQTTDIHGGTLTCDRTWAYHYELKL